MTEKSSSTIEKVDKKSLDNLKSNIKKRGATIILYHWNNCGHCHRFMPIWDELKSMLKNAYNFHDIEYSKMQEAPAAFGNIQSFPTIRMYLTNGKINYEGNRDINSLSSFIKSNVPDLKSSSYSKASTVKESVKTLVKDDIKESVKKPIKKEIKKPVKKPVKK